MTTMLALAALLSLPTLASTARSGFADAASQPASLGAAPAATLVAPPALPQSPPAVEQSVAWRAIESPDVRVTLLDPGTPPLVALRLEPRPELLERLIFTIERFGYSAIDGDHIGGEVPLPITLTIELRALTPPADLAARGVAILCRGTIVSAALKSSQSNPSEQVTATETGLGALRGAAVEFDLGEDAGLRTLRLPETVFATEDGALLADRIARGLREIFPPLPIEAVGVGGSWRAEFNDEVAGIGQRARVTSTIESIEDRRILVSRSVNIVAARERQKLPDGRVAEARGVELEYITGRGGGQVRFDLGSLLPTSLRHEVFVGTFMVGKLEGQEPRRLHEQIMDRTEVGSRSPVRPGGGRPRPAPQTPADPASDAPSQPRPSAR